VDCKDNDSSPDKVTKLVQCRLVRNSADALAAFGAQVTAWVHRQWQRPLRSQESTWCTQPRSVEVEASSELSEQFNVSIKEVESVGYRPSSRAVLAFAVCEDT
jgi:hypothetical protein